MQQKFLITPFSYLLARRNCAAALFCKFIAEIYRQDKAPDTSLIHEMEITSGILFSPSSRLRSPRRDDKLKKKKK